jgi:formylmethanofuran dehydrogenase subunit E
MRNETAAAYGSGCLDRIQRDQQTRAPLKKPRPIRCSRCKRLAADCDVKVIDRKNVCIDCEAGING